MPTHIVRSRVPVHLSIVEYDLANGEEVFFSYAWERSVGPPVQRTGQGPPAMQLIGGQGGELTTHPLGLHQDSWLVQQADRDREIEDTRKELENPRGLEPSDRRMLQRTIEKLESTPSKAHDSWFEDRYSGYRILGMQSCGELTVSDWSVAYVNSRMARSRPDLVHLPAEPLDRRTYSCLVKWRKPGEARGQLTIDELKFNQPHPSTDSNNLVSVRYRDVRYRDARYRDAWLPRGESIEFAVSGVQIIRDGKLVPAVTHCHRFADIRSLLDLPNLNPAVQLFSGDTGRPREYFGRDQHHDIWLGEADFLSDTRRNLLRAALSGPILMDISGIQRKKLRGALQLARYREVASAIEPLKPGEWRIVPGSSKPELLNVYFRRNTHAWSMIGLSHDNRQGFCLAADVDPDGNGYSLEKAAEELLEVGVRNALLVDKGETVFQLLTDREDEPEATLRSQHHRCRRLPAVLIFAAQPQPKGPS